MVDGFEDGQDLRGRVKKEKQGREAGVWEVGDWGGHLPGETGAALCITCPYHPPLAFSPSPSLPFPPSCAA